MKYRRRLLYTIGRGDSLCKLLWPSIIQDKGYMTLDWKTEGVPSKDNMRCFLRATDTAVPMLEAMSQAFFC